MSADFNLSSIPAAEPNLVETLYCDLLAAISRRDEAAFREFYQATVGRVYHLALRITGVPEAAEEVVPEVYLKVWREAHRYDALRGKVLTWLLIICRSRALDYLRRQEEAEPHADPESLASEQAAENGPEDLLSLLERDRAIHHALANLLPAQRQLIALAFLKGYTHIEIARYTHRPLGTVKAHIRKALEKLKRSLSHEQP
ncbi:MAG: RNA polymerase sigma factor [Burkholderiales bacterium]